MATSAEKAEVLLRCYYLAEFISEGLVDADYKPPVQMTTAMKFTTRGRGLANQVKGGKFDIRDAQVAIFTAVWAGSDLLIDLDETDLQTISSFLSGEIKRKRIRLPWVYGRRLYDKVAESPFWGVSHPTAEESQRLLEDMPQGVFQLGPYLSGPFGLVETQNWRTIFYSHTVPGFHCEEVECDSIHGVHLRSGDNGISRAGLAIREKLSKSVKLIDDESIDAIARVASKHMPPYRWNNTDRLPFFLVDTCSTDELRLLLAALLNSKDKFLRAECAKLAIAVASAEEFSRLLDDAQILQLILLCRDSDIHRELNNLIWSRNKGIQIQEGELRRSRIAPGGTGPLSIRIESSRYGARYRPSASRLQIRLGQLIEKSFPHDDKRSLASLKWRLRHLEGETAEARLKMALAEENPVELIEKLLLSDEISYERTLDYLGLAPDKLTHEDDNELARLIAWHIGFPIETEGTELVDLQRTVVEMRNVLGNLPANHLERNDIDKVSGVAGRLFPALEKVFKVVLQFSTWALLRDHYAEGYELTYSPARGREFFVDWMRGRSSRIEDAKLADMDLDLSELLSCFGIVSKFFRQICANPSDHMRPQEEWPRVSKEPSNPFEFPLRHSYPILDLDRVSAASLIETMEKVAPGLSGAEVTRVRNKFLHDSDVVPDREDIAKAIAEIETRVLDLAGQGLYPIAFSSNGSKTDRYGREKYFLSSSLGAEITITRPTSTMLYGFPSLLTPQLVLPGTRLARGGESLRFFSSKDSAYMAHWEKNFPIRPPRRSLATSMTDVGDAG